MEWRRLCDIPGYEEFTNYVLNIAGELRNIKTRNTRKWQLNKEGYMEAVLNQKPAKPKHIKQHRAICCLFKPNPMNLPEVDHINRERWDNRIENLQWATRVQQQHNKGMRIDNTSGEKNICPTFFHGNPIWEIKMRLKGKTRYKSFPRDLTSDEIPQEVKDFRDAMQLEIQTELNKIINV